MPNAAASENWQPIATAPRDGSYLILFSPDSEQGIFLGQWREDEEFPGGGAWWQDNEGGFPVDADASHWMPLPTPPAQA